MRSPDDALTVMIRNNETGVEVWCNIQVYDIANARTIVLKELDKLLEKDFGLCSSIKQRRILVTTKTKPT